MDTPSHKTMKIKVPEAEILRTPIKIEKLSLRNRSGSGFTMNFEFHGFQKKNIFFSLTKYGSMEYLKGSYSISKGQGLSVVAQGSPEQKFWMVAQGLIQDFLCGGSLSNVVTRPGY